MWTIERWRYLATVPSTINFPTLTLQGRDFEPPIVTGAGSITWESPNHFSYRLVGKPDDEAFVFRAYDRLRANPYDGLLRFRLFGEDGEGKHHALGWTIPTASQGKVGEDWTFTGQSSEIWVDDLDVPQSDFGAAEAEIWISKDSYVASVLASIFRRDSTISCSVLESEITMRFEIDRCRLLIRASGSPSMLPHYAENWLAVDL